MQYKKKLYTPSNIPNAITHHKSNPLKPKGLVMAYTGKATYNARGTTIHSALFLPFNKSTFTPLNNDTMDFSQKHYAQLQLLFIGSRFLYLIDKRLREIKHCPTMHFGGVYIIFCGDFYQAQPIQDNLII